MQVHTITSISFFFFARLIQTILFVSTLVVGAIDVAERFKLLVVVGACGFDEY